MVPVSARVAVCRNSLFFALRALLLTGLACVLPPIAAQAQYFPAGAVPEPFDDQTTSGVVLLGREDGFLGPYMNTGYFGPYIHLSHLAGDGPGYRDNGYTTLGLFVPRQTQAGILFTEGRLAVNDFGDMLGSVGGGYRYYMPEWNRTLGSSFWYDVDGGHRGTFSQIGASFETRGENWDLFGNLYLPVGEDDKLFNRFAVPTGDAFVGFAGRNLVINAPNLVTRQFESAMRGVDVEFGGPLPYAGQYGIRGYGGWYYFNKDNTTDINGGRFRLQAELTDSLTGQFMLTNDNEFDTSVIFNITWTLPGSGANRSPYNAPVNRSGRTFVRAQSPEEEFSISQRYRLFEPVQRSTRVFVTTSNVRTVEDNFVDVTDPVTGQPITIFHMDSRAAMGGDGSFEMPFNNPQEAEDGTGAGAIIFTHAGSVFDNPTNNFIALQSNQRLLGEGVPHFVMTEQFGSIAIPPSGDMGPLPQILNSPGNAIVLANGSLVSGFQVDGSGGAAFFANGTLTGTARIDRSSVDGGLRGLDVDMSTGTVNVASSVDIANTTGAALRVFGGTPTVNYDGTITNTAGRAIDIQMLEEDGVVNVNGAVTDNGGTGILVMDSAGQINIADADLNVPAGDAVTLLDNPDAVIRFGRIDATADAGNAFVARNSGDLGVNDGNLDATGGQALFLDDNGTGDPFVVNLRFNNVASTNSALLNGAGITVDSISGIVTVAGTATIDAPTGNGIEFIDSAAVVTFANVDIDDTAGAGIFLQDNSGVAPNLLTGTLVVNGGSIDGSLGSSFEVMGGSANTLYQGDINHTTAGTRIVSIQDTSTGTIVFNTGTLTATDGTGILLDNADGNATFNGTTTLMGGMAGVDIIDGSSGTFLFGANASITDPDDTAFFIEDSAPNLTYAGTIDQSVLGRRAVDIDGMLAAGRARFTGTVTATDGSTGFIIQNSAGITTVSSYIAGDRDANARLTNTALTIMDSIGTQQFDNVDLFTDGGEGLFVTNPVQQGTLGITTGRIDTTGASAIDITNTNVSTVLFTEVVAADTGGAAGVSLDNLGGGSFTISDSDDMTMADLSVTNTAGGDGLSITGLDFSAFVGISSADISDTGGGDAIHIFDAVANVDGVSDVRIVKSTIDDTAGGAGINVDSVEADLLFDSVSINNTGGGSGVQLTDFNGNALFDDGDNTTNDDLTVTMTVGGDGVNITRSTEDAFISFAGVSIDDTLGGNGINIVDADGVIVFDDNSFATAPDVTITNTGGGDGIRISDPDSSVTIAFSTVSIDNTGVAGNGVHIINGDGEIAFGDTSSATMDDLMINTVGAVGHGIFIEDSLASADISFTTVDIETGGGDAINIFGSPGVTAQGDITFDDGDDDTDSDVNITGTTGGDGIVITSSGVGADFRFSSVDITNTAGGTGVTILGTAGDPAVGSVTFGDGNASTTNDLEISMTGGGDGINIIGTGVGGSFSFSSVDISDTAGGHGVSIGDPMNLVNTLGTITFSDGVGGTLDDLTVEDTDGGTGLLVQNSGATFIFSSIDISDTGVPAMGFDAHGVSLVDNTSAVTIGGGDIRNAGGTAFNIDGGAQNVTYNGTVSSNTMGLLVNVQEREGGTVDFNGMLQSTTGGEGIVISDAVAANTVRFDGAVNLGVNAANGVSRLMDGTAAVDIDNNGTASQIVFANLDIFTDGVTGLMAGNGGNLQILTGRINTIDAPAIVLDTINLNTVTLANSGPFGALTVNGAGGAGVDAVSFTDVTGTFTVTGSTSITNTSSDFDNGISIDGGSAVYSFNPGLLQTTAIDGSSGDAISMTDTTGGSLTIGNLAITNSLDGGVALANNVGTVNITGGSIASTAGTAFEVIGGGASVTYSGTIDNTSGLAVDIQNRTGGTVDFNGAIASNGAGMGINITGSTGVNTVRFDGAVDLGTTTALTGGTAVNVNNGGVGASVLFTAGLNIVTDGVAGLMAANGGNLSINTGSIDVTDAQGININGVNLNTVTLTSVDVTNSGALTDALVFDTVTGTFTTGATTVDGADTLSGINIDDGTATLNFGTTMITSTTVAGNAIDIDGAGGPITFGTTTITNSAMSGISVANTLAAGDVLFGETNISGVTDDAIVLTDNNGDFTTNGGTLLVAAGQTGIIADYTTTTGDITINGSTAPLVINGDGGAPAAGINITNSGTSTFQVLINNTTIGTADAPLDGVLLFSTGTGTLNATLTNNTVDAVNSGLTAETVMGATMRLNIGTNATNGTTTPSNLGNDFEPDYVFTNNGTMNLGVDGSNTAFTTAIPDNATLILELDTFDNTTGGAAPNASYTGNDIIAVDPTTIPVP